MGLFLWSGIDITAQHESCVLSKWFRGTRINSLIAKMKVSHRSGRTPGTIAAHSTGMTSFYVFKS